MRYTVFDMKKYSKFLLCLAFLWSLPLLGQNKYEREYRIRKSQFPEKAHRLIAEQLLQARRIRFYRETDSAETSYEAKFKKDRLHYSVEFDEKGQLEDIEILIKEVDLPSESFSNIRQYLDTSFRKYRIRRIQQQYVVTADEQQETTLKNAFQNLLLPGINYELMVAGKRGKSYMDYEILFDSEGNFIRQRTSLPANYDHVLY